MTKTMKDGLPLDASPGDSSGVGESPEPSRAPQGMDPGLRLAHRLDKMMAAEEEWARTFALLFLEAKYKFGPKKAVPYLSHSELHCNVPPLE